MEEELGILQEDELHRPFLGGRHSFYSEGTDGDLELAQCCGCIVKALRVPQSSWVGAQHGRVAPVDSSPSSKVARFLSVYTELRVRVKAIPSDLVLGEGLRVSSQTTELLCNLQQVTNYSDAVVLFAWRI